MCAPLGANTDFAFASAAEEVGRRTETQHVACQRDCGWIGANGWSANFASPSHETHLSDASNSATDMRFVTQPSARQGSATQRFRDRVARRVLGQRSMKHATLAAHRRSDGRFYMVVGGSILVLACVGFAPSYFLRAFIPPAHPLAALTALIHLHAFLFTGWLVLLVAQATLVARSRSHLHRWLGMASLGWAVLMVVVGTLTALHSIPRGTTPPFAQPFSFLAIQVFDLVVFTLLVAGGFVWRRAAGTHQRLMIMSGLCLLPPALARLMTPLGSGLITVFCTSYLGLVGLVVWDLWTRRAVHRATVLGSLLIVASLPLRLLVSKTDAWLEIATFAMRWIN